MYRFLLRPLWIFAHPVVAIVVAVCVALGFWQLRRLDERRTYNARIAQQTALPPENLERLLPSASIDPQEAESRAYRRITVRGAYDPEREVVLRARSFRGRPGNHLLTPVVTGEGAAVLVDRGWVPLPLDEPPVAEALPPPGPVELTGVLLPPEPAGLFGPKDPPPGPVRAISRVDPERLASQLPYSLYPLYLRLENQESPQAGPLPEMVPLPELDEGPHLGYAGQWFLFAAIATITYGALIRREVRGRRREQGDLGGRRSGLPPRAPPKREPPPKGNV
jgi:surfeit locus 1 family protein